MGAQRAERPEGERQRRSTERERRRRSAEREQRIARLATRQHGVVSRQQLEDAGLSRRAIARRVEAGRLHRLHRGVYAVGHRRLTRRGHWMGAVLACGAGAALSHRSAAALWGLAKPHRGPIEVSARRGRRRGGILVRACVVADDDATVVAGIPVTTVARTLLDLAESVDTRSLEHAFDEADRLGLLKIDELECACARGRGRRALKPLRRLIDADHGPATRSPLEDRLVAFCRDRGLPAPETNVIVLGREVDAFWPEAKLMAEADSYEFHSHRGAFEGDRVRDAAMLVSDFRVIRLTHRRLTREPDKVAAELRLLLGPHRESGQGTVEWVALLLLIALLFAGLVAAGVRVPGASLAQAIASRILCAAAVADSCGDEPALIAAYGTEVGKLAREHMPMLMFERGARALPVDFRRCRSSACGDGSARGLVARTDRGLPVTAFIHVVDCRPDAVEAFEEAGADCSDPRAGNLYIQYWTYYADSATLRGVPIVGRRGYHRDDWESVQVRIGPDGRMATRASSHSGFNSERSRANWASDARASALKDATEWLGARPRNGWGPETGLLLVSGGSHAGNTAGFPRIDRLTPGRRVHLVPLESVAAPSYRFVISPPWLKRVWRDPEAKWTD